MARENYLLQRSRLIMTELEQEYQRVYAVDKTNESKEKTEALEIIKTLMFEVEDGIKLLENFLLITD